MGLAPFGAPTYDFPQLQVDGLRLRCLLANQDAERRDPTAEHRRVYRAWIQLCEQIFGPPREPKSSLSEMLWLRYSDDYTDAHANAAASVQAVLEAIIEALVGETARIQPGLPIILAGGVALNCSVNGHIRRTLPDVDLRLVPVPHDAGGSLGAAILAAREVGDPVQPVTDPYLGIGWSDADVADVLTHFGIRYIEPEDLGTAVANRVLDGATIGWFQGRAEVGPRALGHRSILASPSEKEVARHLNQQVKLREVWRPFAPSVLPVDMPVLYGIPDAPYMMEAHALREAERLPAVVHVDGTSRPHSVDSSSCSDRYTGMLEAMRDWTGLGVVLNTSFNVGPEPIVYTPSDALRTYFSSPLDGLAMGPFFLEKRPC
jgi:carbamoyltransferase